MQRIRRALLVGVNTYHFDDVPGVTEIDDLRGCLNDVADMEKLLRASHQTTVLRDEQAKRGEILAALDALVAEPNAGGHFVFFFAGHGAVMSRDGRDQEVLLPHDTTFNAVWGNAITDGDLASRFKRLPEDASLEVVLDSCMSAGMDRLGVQTAGPQLRQQGVRTCRPPPQFAPKGTRTIRLRAKRRVGRFQYAFWAASHQFACEQKIDGTYRGLFTYHLCKQVRDGGGDIERGRLDDALAAVLKGQKPRYSRNRRSCDDEKVFSPTPPGKRGRLYDRMRM